MKTTKEKEGQQEQKANTVTLRDISNIARYIHGITLSVGELVKTRRKTLGLTISELSKYSKVSTTVITDLENARSLPRTEVLLKLAHSLDIPYGRLFSTFDVASSTFIFAPDVKRIPTLRDMILNEGLGELDVKEIMNFIEFKKYRNKNRK